MALLNYPRVVAMYRRSSYEVVTADDERDADCRQITAVIRRLITRLYCAAGLLPNLRIKSYSLVVIRLFEKCFK